MSVPSAMPVSSCIGLTGGIAAGKSTTSERLRRWGWFVVDSDEIAHELMAPGGETWQKLVDVFGERILNEEKAIDRKKLGSIVFRDPQLRETLNRLTHPAIIEKWRKEVADLRARNPNGKIVVSVPLLHEAGLEGEFETILCIGCSYATQLRRLLTRGLEREEAEARIKSQWPIEKKAARSDVLLWNDGSLELLEQQISRFVLVSSSP
ncbi:dephospho-CoA kinase [Methylacidimicrobium sp. AP8]|uniref:dephospho-CoA kinase n=1 Tax=Methylacidimicrobium sp. AP8 TaxID=2730359 RepID=UPI001EEE8BA3|nr:dephospho-CoA kinase [Methylacidimicrobium sp. AP8]